MAEHTEGNLGLLFSKACYSTLAYVNGFHIFAFLVQNLVPQMANCA